VDMIVDRQTDRQTDDSKATKDTRDMHLSQPEARLPAELLCHTRLVRCGCLDHTWPSISMQAEKNCREGG